MVVRMRAATALGCNCERADNHIEVERRMAVNYSTACLASTAVWFAIGVVACVGWDKQADFDGGSSVAMSACEVPPSVWRDLDPPYYESSAPKERAPCPRRLNMALDRLLSGCHNQERQQLQLVLLIFFRAQIENIDLWFVGLKWADGGRRFLIRTAIM
jgi:hypothetical protein